MSNPTGDARAEAATDCHQLPPLVLSGDRQMLGMNAVEKRYGINWNGFVYPLFQIGETQGQVVCDLATALDHLDQRERQLLAAQASHAALLMRTTDYLLWLIKQEEDTHDDDLPGFVNEAALRAKEMFLEGK